VHALRGLGLLPDLVSPDLMPCINQSLICSLDCVPVVSTATAFVRHQRQNLHVLPRLFGASIWSTRRHICISRSPPPPVTRHCVLPPETT
jgi:hypothetical protein